jgi:internalin A
MLLSYLAIAGMKKVRVLISTAALLFQLIPATASTPQQPKLKSFAEWCQQKTFVPIATRNTIDILLSQAGSKDCRLADTKLRTHRYALDRLNLSRSRISDSRSKLTARTEQIKLSQSRSKSN